MQWTCQLVVKTGTPPEGGVDGPSPGGVTLFQGEFSPPTGWLDKLLHVIRHPLMLMLTLYTPRGGGSV